MSEWWTYSLSDFLMFSPNTYYRLFELYNADIWPGQPVALVAGLLIIWALRTGRHGQAVGWLGVCWLWIAYGFFHRHYSSITWAADYAAVAFAVQGGLLLLLAPRLKPRHTGALGYGLVIFALAVMPLLGLLAGRSWAQIELFGVAPDPTTIATLGVLVLATHWSRWLLLVVPVAWSLVGGATLLALEAPDAAVMPAAALLVLAASVVAIYRRIS